MGAHAVSLLTFPHAVGVRGEVYGTAWPLSVEGAEVSVRLPRFNVGSSSTRDRWPTSPEIPNAEKLSEWLTDDTEWVQWGETLQHGPGPQLSSVVGTVKHAALVVVFPDDTTDHDERLTVTGNASETAEDWCRRVVAWLSLRLLHHIDPSFTGMVVGDRMEYTSGSWLHETAESPSGWDRLRPSRRVIGIQVSSTWPDLGYEMFANTLDDWEQAAVAASTNLDIPAEWQLLDSAFDACLKDSFRVAVLDAATALDLVLADVARPLRSRTHSAAEADEWLDTQTLGNNASGSLGPSCEPGA